MKPYRLEAVTVAGPPALPFIRAAFLITMEGSTRRPLYMRTLRAERPTKTVYVLHNRGFRRSHKPGVRNTMEDLWHANQTIFHLCAAAESGYILVMEDDVVLRGLRTLAPEIRDVLARGPDVLFLGGTPLVSVSAGGPAIRAWLCGEAHAVVYSASAVRRLRHATLPRGVPHDMYVSFAEKTYVMSKPAAAQLHPATENMAHWDYLGLCSLYIRMMGADTNPWTMTQWHHAYGAMGGIYVVYTAMCVAIIAVVAASVRQRLAR